MNDWMIVCTLFVAVAVGASLFAHFAGYAFTRFWGNTLDQVQRQLTGLFLFNNAQTLSVAYVLALLIVPVFLWFAGISVVMIALVFGCVLLTPRILFAILRKRRSVAIAEALPDALSQLASGMRSGATFTVSLQALAEEDSSPLGEEISLMLREHRMGARIEDALDNLAERLESEEIDLVVSAVLIAQDVGGNLAEILQGLSITIRRKLEMEGKISALTSQGMLQGYVVSALPFALLLALSFIEADATLPIFNSLLGWVALAFMAVLQFTGALMIKKIVSIEV